MTTAIYLASSFTFGMALGFSVVTQSAIGMLLVFGTCLGWLITGDLVIADDGEFSR